MTLPCVTIGNPGCLPLDSVPLLSQVSFGDAIGNILDAGGGMASCFGFEDNGATRILAVMRQGDGRLALFSTSVTSTFQSLTPRHPVLHLFEREIHEQFGITPVGHPWLKPVRFVPPLSVCSDAPVPPIGVTNYFRVEGEQVHEVAVGPVHAGIIEPGHFRFQCHGEEVFHLEISLGYQHRGIERELIGGPNRRTLRQMETIAGDTTIGHAGAYCMIREVLGGCVLTERHEALRAVALELERLANHSGDLGALAGDVGYLPTMSYCGRIRGDFLNMTAVLCGSRFGRGLLEPGGVSSEPDSREVEELLARLASARSDLTNAIELLWNTPSVINRFDQCGCVSTTSARKLGLVGPAARACGSSQDIRRDLPWGHYRQVSMPVAVMQSGDVYARAQIRWMECCHSLDFIEATLRHLPQAHAAPVGDPHIPAGMIAVALTEGWRGEICHAALTGNDGRFRRYKIKDPSFHNWSGLAMALRNNEISDFPLNNKSFNLSYCGYDL